MWHSTVTFISQLTVFNHRKHSGVSSSGSSNHSDDSSSNSSSGSTRFIGRSAADTLHTYLQVSLYNIFKCLKAVVFDMNIIKKLLFK
jgi:hypothetical protein